MKKITKYTRVFVSGNFYLLHPGHIRFLNFASELGDELIIGVDPSIPSDEFPCAEERIEALESLGIASSVVSLDDGLEATIKRFKPMVVVKGKEYAGRSNVEEAIVAQWGGKVVFSSGESTYFEEHLIANSKRKRGSSIVRVDDYLKRHKCDMDRLESFVDRFSELKVLIIGDTIIDEYVECDVLGMSREDPTIVVSPRKSRKFLGGAGIVAAHASALGATVRFTSLIGDDDAGVFASSQLADFQVSPDLVVDESRPTTLKVRYRADGRTMFRVSHLRQHEASPKLQAQLIEIAASRISNSDLVVFSDFNYGCLPTPVCSKLVDRAKRAGAFVAADSQSSSQVGDISRFYGADLVTPTEYEARLALRDQLSGLSIIAPSLLQHLDASRALVTLGKSGLLAIEVDQEALGGYRSDSLPALNQVPVDVAGAGDSVLVVSAMALKLGANLYEAAFLGSLAAAIQTSRVGNIPIRRIELLASLQTYLRERELA